MKYKQQTLCSLWGLHKSYQVTQTTVSLIVLKVQQAVHYAYSQGGIENNPESLILPNLI